MVYFNEEKREYQRNWMKKRRENLINNLGNKCSICESQDRLEFHHKDPSIKSFSINSKLSYNEKELEEELNKCELLCFECHKKKHIRKIIHGTTTAYGYGCRCDDCRKANTVRRAEYRARTGKR